VRPLAIKSIDLAGLGPLPDQKSAGTVLRLIVTALAGLSLVVTACAAASIWSAAS
jgi:hypothetical protein